MFLYNSVLIKKEKHVKIFYIIIFCMCADCYSAQNSIVEPKNKEKLQDKLNQIRRQFSSEFLKNENLDVVDGRLSPRKSLSNSGNVTRSGSSGKLLSNESSK